jgi:protein gp37
MAETAIEWATHVWNPVTGCDRVSPGCAHCYALTYAGRLKAMGQPKYQRDGGKASGPGFGVTLHEAALAEPARWRKPRRVFVNSMSDLFHEEIPDEFIARVFAVMGEADRHEFLVLTKRPERMHALLRSWRFCKLVMGNCARAFDAIQWDEESYFPNVWLGVSIENRRYVYRADLLRETPAAVRFISAEPLLGPLFEPYDGWEDDYAGAGLALKDVDWVIVGGESGPNHRPIRPEWVRDIRDATRSWADDEVTQLPGRHCAFFFKQWGGPTPKSGGRELDGRTWDELPAPATSRQEASAHV